MSEPSGTQVLEDLLLQDLTPPLSVGYLGFHGNWSPFTPESGLTDRMSRGAVLQ